MRNTHKSIFKNIITLLKLKIRKNIIYDNILIWYIIVLIAKRNKEILHKHTFANKHKQ